MMSKERDSEPWGPFFAEALSPCFVVRLEARGFVLAAVNRAWEETTGLTREQAIGRPALDHLPADVRELNEQRLKYCMEQRQVCVYDEQLSFPSGARCWCTTLAPWPREQPTAVIGIAQDITERMHSERALRESEARFRRLAENAQDVIYRYRLRPTQAFEYISPVIEQITGYSPDEYYADPELWQRTLHADDSDKFERYSSSPTPARWLTKDGRTVWLEARVAQIFDDAGQLVALEGIARDITERKRQEEERRAFEHKLLETQKLESLGVLAGGVAHDFNNLLTGILGRVSLMRGAMPEPTPEREHVDQIEHAAVQAADLCRQMLAYSGKGRFMVRRIDLSELVRDTVPLLQVTISKSAALNLRLAHGLPAISGDAAQLRQLIMNLVSNASEALIDGIGTITITTSSRHATEQDLQDTLLTHLSEGRYVCIDVSDTGTGMSPETKQRIFDPFYTTKFTGRGLGLPAALGIVRGHQGALKVHSDPGRGTSFKVYLPAVEGAGERLARPHRVSKGYRGSGTILIIDDEEVVRSVTTRILQSFGFKVLSAAEGIEGLTRFRTQMAEISAVLLDLTMPGMDGEAVFRELRTARSDVPVLLMSGYNEQDAIARFAGKGLSGFLQKPFTVEQLIEKLRHVLEGPP